MEGLGFDAEKYHMKNDFDHMMNLLEALGKDRQENSIIDKKIKMVAAECGLDLDQFQDNIRKYFDKRAIIDAVN